MVNAVLRPTVPNPSRRTAAAVASGEVQQRDRYRGLDLVGDLVRCDLVHCVGAQEKYLGAGSLNAAGDLGKQ